MERIGEPGKTLAVTTKERFVLMKKEHEAFVVLLTEGVVELPLHCGIRKVTKLVAKCM
jgi:hypothetical protein